jgi:hypothetical protein
MTYLLTLPRTWNNVGQRVRTLWIVFPYAFLMGVHMSPGEIQPTFTHSHSPKCESEVAGLVSQQDGATLVPLYALLWTNDFAVDGSVGEGRLIGPHRVLT